MITATSLPGRTQELDTFRKFLRTHQTQLSKLNVLTKYNHAEPGEARACERATHKHTITHVKGTR